VKDLIGTEIGGCLIEELLGKGGMGAVYRGTQQSLNRSVAIKILAEHLGADDAYIQRFMREAHIIAKINHPNITHIYDTGQSEDMYYIAMEFVEGLSLSQAIKRNGPISPDETVDIMLQCAQGLKAAWEHMIIHRDIKPDNILVTSKMRVKIADFGLAKGTAEMDSLTNTGQIMGTPYYMSPEQCRGEDTDFRTDVYSLGVTLYFMLTGSAPFPGANSAEVIYKHINAPIPKLTEALANPALTDFDFILKNCLAKQKVNRYADYGILLQNLEALKRKESLVERYDQPTMEIPPDGPTVLDQPTAMTTAQGQQSAQPQAAGAGEHACPSCKHSFNQAPDFYNEVECPMCQQKFAIAGGAAPSPGVAAEAAPAAPAELGSRSHSSKILSVTDQPRTDENLDAHVRRLLLLQPREALEITQNLLGWLSMRDGFFNLILPENIITKEAGSISVNDCPNPFESLS